MAIAPGFGTESHPGQLSLIKMHGCGNDYVYVDLVGGSPLPVDVDLARLAVELSDRHFGIGGDGLILIQRAPSGRLAMRMFNADGSEGEMCGNGVRCLAAYAYEQEYAAGPRFEIETLAGVVRPLVSPAPGAARRAASVTVDMGPPREVRPGLALELPPAAVFRGIFVSMGNPHFVVIVPEVNLVDLEVVGPTLERHPTFPHRANIEFVQVLAPDRLRLRIWERGSGVTLASGTGSSAALVAAVTAGLAARKAAVLMDGGELQVEWPPGGHVLVTGPTVEVFRTTYSKPLPRLAVG